MKRPWLLTVGLLTGLASLIWVLPHIMSSMLRWYCPGIVFRVPTSQPRIYLTIDDGPSERTDEILSVLTKHKAKATFFIIGNHVAKAEQLTHIRDAGCTLGNHLRTTKACSRLTQQEFIADFDYTEALLPQSRAVALFRPPSDFGRPEQLDHVRKHGGVAVLGTVFPLDHWIDSPRLLRIMIRWLSVKGGIVIMHDGPVRGKTTAVVLDRLIPELRAAGYEFGDLAGDLSPQSAH